MFNSEVKKLKTKKILDKNVLHLRMAIYYIQKAEQAAPSMRIDNLDRAEQSLRHARKAFEEQMDVS